MKYLFSIIAFFISLLNFAQDFSFKTKYEIANDKMITNYFRFESLDYSQNMISGKNIIGKDYIINLNEYKNGKLVSSKKLQNSTNESFSKIESEDFNITILGKRNESKYTLQLFFDRFWNSKINLKLISKHKEDYILKELPIKETDLQFNKPFIFLLLTTPEYHKDGSASWCDVAANETPEKIYEKNKIPHFFVFEMTIL